MSDSEYSEGDFIIIHDVKKANAKISMAADIEAGIIVKIKQKHGGMLICNKVEPTEPVEVMPFPQSGWSSYIFQPSGSEKKISDKDSQNVTSDVGDFLSEDQESKSDSLK